MCSITGAIALGPESEIDSDLYMSILTLAGERGRDAVGFGTNRGDEYRFVGPKFINEDLSGSRWVIGNNRGEPTTEYVPNPTLGDIQPYRSGRFAVVHNGTIANDKDLALAQGWKTPRVDSQIIPLILHRFWTDDRDTDQLRSALGMLHGSYALAAANYETGTVVLACNYKPIFTAVIDEVLYFASLPSHLPGHQTIRSTIHKVEPYSAVVVGRDGAVKYVNLRSEEKNMKALVILSGGLDSTTVAAYMKKKKNYDVTLLHVEYHCRAQEREIEAVEAIAATLELPLIRLNTDIFSEVIRGSTLTSTEGEIAQGEVGSEYAMEWVPARNLILSALAVGIAESRGIDTIALGNNLEESGAYPDNEQEFIRALNFVMPNAVNEGQRVAFIEPVGNLMKHEIVRLGLEIAAPLHLTWSCYKGGEHHCGDCGPCYMRRKAFTMNGVEDAMPYEKVAS